MDDERANHARLLALQEKMNVFQRKSEAERRRDEELDALTVEVRVKINMQKAKEERHDLGGVYAVQNDNKRVQRETKNRENRLNKLRIRCSESVANNESMREKCNVMRQQRKAYEEIYAKLQNQFADKQGQLQRELDSSNDSHERRREAQDELANFKKLDMEEMEEFEERWAQLGELMDDQKSASEHISTAAKRRAEKNELTQDAEFDITTEKEKERGMLQKLDEMQEMVEGQQAQIQQRQARVTDAQSAFSRLQKFAGINDVSKLVTQFVQNEDENYSLFSYIQSVNAEIEKEEEQLAKVSKEMGQHKKEQEAGNSVKQEKVDELRARLSHVQQENETCNREYQNNKAALDALLEHIEALYTSLGCDAGGEAEPGGGSVSALQGPGGISESTVLHYVGTIEQKAVEITNAHILVTAKPTKVRKNIFGPTMRHGARDASARINASLAEDIAAEETDDVPLTHSELKARALRDFRRSKDSALQLGGDTADEDRESKGVSFERKGK
jgi:hypothetical protein